MKASLPSNVFTRMGWIWTRFDFLHNVVLKEKSSRPAWRFWFFWSTVSSLILAGILVFHFHRFTHYVLEHPWATLPEFQMQIQGGELEVRDLEQPLIWDDGRAFGFVLDTQQGGYDLDLLERYDNLIIVTRESIFNKDPFGVEEVMRFSHLPFEALMTKSDLEQAWREHRNAVYQTLFWFFWVSFWFVLCLGRLVMLLFLALGLWPLGRMFGVRGLTYGKTYVALLQFSIVPAVFGMVFLMSGYFLPMINLAILLLVFLLNFWNSKADTHHA